MTAKTKATLTARDWYDLRSRGARIHFNRASLQIRHVPIPGTEGATERRFVMEGPSGRHSLLVDATDLERLNAHWTVFATDARNALAEHHGQMAMDMGLTPAEARALID